MHTHTYGTGETKQHPPVLRHRFITSQRQESSGGAAEQQRQKILQLRDKIQTLEQTVDVLNQRVKNSEGAHDTTRAQMNTINASCKATRAQMTSMNATNAMFRNQIAKHMAEANLAATQRESCAHVLDQCNTDANVKDTAIESCASLVERKDGVITATRNNHAFIWTVISVLQGAIVTYGIVILASGQYNRKRSHLMHH